MVNPIQPAPNTLVEPLDTKDGWCRTRRTTIPSAANTSVDTHSPTVSVIVPVHGVERYIEACLRSVMEQSLRDIEIIPVNDQSPDGSQGIIDRMSADDPRIRPIVMETNVGQGFARNAGIDAALGKYVFFLDADDLLSDERVLEACVAASEASGADLVRVQKLNFRDGEPPASARLDPVEKHFRARRSVEPPLSDLSVLRSWHFWQYLYARDLLNTHAIRFTTPQWEERYFICKALKHAKRLELLPRAGVGYRRRAASTTARERNAADLEIYLRAISDIGAVFAGSREGAAVALQFASHFVGNSEWARCFWRHSARDEGAAFERLRQAFEPFACSFPALIGAAPSILDRPKGGSGAALLLCSLRNENWRFAKLAMHSGTVSQQVLHEHFRQEPGDAEATGLQAALNNYARNEKAQGVNKGRLSRVTRPRLVLHIGASKTGSTSLQHFLEGNRPALFRNGVWYPEVGLYWQAARPHKQAGHARFIPAARSGDTSLRRYLDSGVQLSNGRIHTILLSSEAFFLDQSSHEVVRYLADYPCEVVIYLRRQDEWANSQYCEFVGGGAVNRVSEPMDAWLKAESTRQLLDYRNVLARFETVVPRERITVRVFDPPGFGPGGLASDFSRATGLPELDDLPRAGQEAANDAVLSGAQIRCLKDYNARPFSGRDAYFQFINEVERELTNWRDAQGRAPAKPMLLDSAQRQAILDEWRDANAEIARTWLGREDGRLFDDTLPAPAAAEEPISDSEKSFIEAAYRHWADAEATRGTGPGFGNSRLVNYGLFGWRRWALTPFVRIGVRRHGSADDLAQFDHEPASYLHGLDSPKYRKLAGQLYPQGSVLGPGHVLGLWVGPMAWIAGRIGGEESADELRADPVYFVRRRKNPLVRALGRLAFPIGELAPGNEQPEADMFGY